MRSHAGGRWTRFGALAAAVTVATAPAVHAEEAKAGGTRDVMFVGNNWDGTVDLIEGESFD